jgi:hypothetical protein
MPHANYARPYAARFVPMLSAQLSHRPFHCLSVPWCQQPM